MFTVPSCTQFLLFFLGLLLWRSITTSAPKNPVAGCLWDGRAKQQCLPPPTWCWHILARLGTPGVVVYQCLPHQFGSTKETTKIGSSGGPRPVFWCFLYLNRLNLQPTSLKPSISAHQDIRAHDLLGGGYAMFTYTKGWFLTGGSLFSQGIPWPAYQRMTQQVPHCLLQAGHQSLFQHLIRLIQNHRLYIRERNPGRDSA